MNNKSQLEKVLKRASQEVAKWPRWKRSPDVAAELDRLNKDTKPKWKDQLGCIIEERGDFGFGHNVEISKQEILRFCTKLEKLGATELDIEDYYTVKMIVPSPLNLQRDLFLYLLTFSPHPTDAVFNKKTERLTLDWHY